MTARRPNLDRVYQGDAIEVMKSWPSGFCSLLLADAPYGNRGARYGRARRTILNDSHPLTGLSAIAAAQRLLKRDAVGFFFTTPRHLGFTQNFLSYYTDYRLKEVLVWSKGSPGFGYTFRRSFELIVVLEKGNPSYFNTPVSTVLQFSRANTKDHPHAKPVPLLEKLVEISTQPGDIVLDPFAGSASAGVAALNLQRRYLGVELDSLHAEVGRRRLEKHQRAA